MRRLEMVHSLLSPARTVAATVVATVSSRGDVVRVCISREDLVAPAVDDVTCSKMAALVVVS